MQLTLPMAMVIYGKSDAGKSKWIEYVLSIIWKDFDYPLVFSSTKFGGGYDYIPEECVKEKYSDEIVEKLLKYHKEMHEKGTPKKCIIILDDIIGTVKFRDDVMYQLFTTYRHYGISLITSTQHPTLIPPYIRNNVKYVTFFEQSNANSLETLCKEYCPSNMSKKEFVAMFSWLDRKGKVMLENTSISQNNLAEKFVRVEYPNITEKILLFQ